MANVGQEMGLWELNFRSTQKGAEQKEAKSLEKARQGPVSHDQMVTCYRYNWRKDWH